MPLWGTGSSVPSAAETAKGSGGGAEDKARFVEVVAHLLQAWAHHALDHRRWPAHERERLAIT